MRRPTSKASIHMPNDGNDEIIGIIGMVVVTALLTIAYLVSTLASSQPKPGPQQPPPKALRPAATVR